MIVNNHLFNTMYAWGNVDDTSQTYIFFYLTDVSRTKYKASYLLARHVDRLSYLYNALEIFNLSHRQL